MTDSLILLSYLVTKQVFIAMKKSYDLTHQILTVDLLKRYFRIPFIQGKV